MTSEHEPRLSAEDERLVRAVNALYRPPEPPPGARARFAARLDERIARGRGRRSGWLVGAAAATAALALLLVRLPEPGSPGDANETSAVQPSTEETLLWLANGPLEDPDEALPDDYQTLASLLD